MNVATTHEKTFQETLKADPLSDLKTSVVQAWKIITPFWPLKHLIAINPLQGLEDLPIEEATEQANYLFQKKSFPQPLEEINRETIKWLQAFYDQGQATIQMPDKQKGLYRSWKQLVIYDQKIHKNDPIHKMRLKSLPDDPTEALHTCLSLLDIGKEKTLKILKLLLTTLPGWASFIKYRFEWSSSETEKQSAKDEQIDYLAMRAVMTLLLWPEAGKTALKEDLHALKRKETLEVFKNVDETEKKWRTPLLERLREKAKHPVFVKPDAQLVFCIDVRSERIRRAVEASGPYETLGFAGFFGVPIRIKNTLTQESRASCPVLLSPQHEVEESIGCPTLKQTSMRSTLRWPLLLQQIYMSMKHNFTSSLAIVESLGLFAGCWMVLKTFFPNLSGKLLIKPFHSPTYTVPNLSNLPFRDRCAYAETSLRVMGLIDHFSPLVVFCGHGSTTTNNAFASALDCGACGGNHGGTNAQTLAAILNQSEVRKHLEKKAIFIPEDTLFLGALHNTTTDKITLLDPHASEKVSRLQTRLKYAQQLCAKDRYQSFSPPPCRKRSEVNLVKYRSLDWAQVRPEWGLAKNAAFIVAPRRLTQNHNLEGRCFLHSYEPDKDPDGKSLEIILTAPMVVAQWINSQYFFSTFDHISFGSGSKVTKNIVGKFGIMQGNASDLMTGLPLQSVYSSDQEPYHELQRLMVVVYAPISRISPLIQKHPILQKLMGNGWVQLVSIDPQNHEILWLSRHLSWEKTSLQKG